MKYCRDCKYCTLRGICVSPLNPISPVTGEPRAMFAEVSRSANFGSCGPDAKNFEPREVESSLWNKILNLLK